MSDMRRAGLFIAMILGLGALTTVFIAWVCATVPIPVSLTHDERNRFLQWTTREHLWIGDWQVDSWASPGFRSWLLRPREFLPPTHTWYELSSVPAPRWSIASKPYDRFRTFRAIEDASGWPIAAMYCRRGVVASPFILPNEYVEGGLAANSAVHSWMIEKTQAQRHALVDVTVLKVNNQRAIPLRIIWPGFIASTLMYGAAWVIIVLLLTTPPTMRRIIRRWRSRCIACGYILHVQGPQRCSECGWMIRRRFPLVTGGRLWFTAAALAVVVVATIAFGAYLTRTVEGPDEIFIAARRNDAGAIRRLVAAGVSPDLRYVSGEWIPFGAGGTTPLMWAAAHDNIEAALELIETGADVNFATSIGKSCALETGCQYGARRIVRILIEAGSYVNGHGGGSSSPLHAAARASHETIVRDLLDAGAEVNASRSGRTALHEAARIGSVEVVRLLVDRGANLEAVDRSRGFSDPPATPLGYAAEAGQVDAMAWLIDAGASLGPHHGGSPLLSAIASGSAEVVQNLLDRGATVDAAAGPLLVRAAKYGSIDILRQLIKAGADANQPGNYDRTPLWTAIFHSRTEIARLLLEAGADPHVIDADGQTLLFFFTWGDQPLELLDLLLDHGVEVNHQDNVGNTVLIIASNSRRHDVVERLLAAGADPMLRNAQGLNAIDCAANRVALRTTAYTSFEREPDESLAERLRSAVRLTDDAVDSPPEDIQ